MLPLSSVNRCHNLLGEKGIFSLALMVTLLPGDFGGKLKAVQGDIRCKVLAAFSQ